MKDRIIQEAKLIEKSYGEVKLDPNYRWIIIVHFVLPKGWNKSETRVLIYIPAGYPITPPDNFFTDPDLRLANGAMPGNVSANEAHLGSSWMRFSYHVECSDWHGSADILLGDNLMSFLVGIRKRFLEVS